MQYHFGNLPMSMSHQLVSTDSGMIKLKMARWQKASHLGFSLSSPKQL